MHLACDGVGGYAVPSLPRVIAFYSILGETRHHAIHMARGCRAPNLFGSGNIPLTMEMLKVVWYAMDVENLGKDLSDVG